MNINKKDLKIERITGHKHCGGANRNNTKSCVRVTHLPSGIVVRHDGRDQNVNLRNAMRDLERRLGALKADSEAKSRKDRRDAAIQDHTVIRDYDFKSGTVYDRRSKKTATIKNVLDKGRIDLLKPDSEVP